MALFDPAAELSATFQLPRNVERAYLDVILQHQAANDEFWYACVPTKLAGELQSCVGTAFREGQLSIDGQQAGVVPIYPWIFTGGVDPFFWRPIPAPQALNFVPYCVDVTPFAGVLSDGQPHRFAIKVTNDSQYLSTTATLLLHLDQRSTQVTGAVTQNTIGAPSPAVNAVLNTDPTGTVTGTVTTTSSRQFVLAGWARGVSRRLCQPRVQLRRVGRHVPDPAGTIRIAAVLLLRLRGSLFQPRAVRVGRASTGESKDQHHAGDSSHAGDLGMRPPIASSRGPRMCNLRLL